MDNFTIFGTNRREMKKLIKEMAAWLKAHGLRFKDGGVIFKTKDRLPSALGYRYGRDHTIVRKKNLFKLKRQIAKYQRKIRQSKKILKGLALSILSRLGQLKHCNSYRIRRRYAPQILIEELKAIIRNYAKEEKLKKGEMLCQTAS